MEDDLYNIAKIVVLSGWALTLLVCFIVLLAAIYSLAKHGTIDITLKEFAILCFGFLFGNIPVLVKEFMKPN